MFDPTADRGLHDDDLIVARLTFCLARPSSGGFLPGVTSLKSVVTQTLRSVSVPALRSACSASQAVRVMAIVGATASPASATT